MFPQFVVLFYNLVRALVVTSFSCGQFSKFLVLFLKLVHKLVNQAKLCVHYVFYSGNATETPEFM